MTHSAGAGDDQVLRDADEEAVLDNAGARAEQDGEAGRIGDRAETAVENDVTLIGAVKSVLAVARSRSDSCADAFEKAGLRAPAEFQHLDRQGPACADAG